MAERLITRSDAFKASLNCARLELDEALSFHEPHYRDKEQLALIYLPRYQEFQNFRGALTRFAKGDDEKLVLSDVVVDGQPLPNIVALKSGVWIAYFLTEFLPNSNNTTLLGLLALEGVDPDEAVRRLLEVLKNLNK